jgi:hypothetical protein
VLFEAIGYSVVLLVAGYVAIWRSRAWVIGFVTVGLYLVLFPPFGSSAGGYPVVALQFVGLAILVPCLRSNPRLGTAFRIVTPLAVTAASYGFCTWLAVRGFHEYDRLRTVYPYESVEERMPAPAARSFTLTADSKAQLYDLEGITDTVSWDGVGRTARLQRLHETTVHSFVDSPGFGVQRLFLPTAETLMHGVRNSQPIAQPVARALLEDSVDRTESKFSTAIPEGLDALHNWSVADFAYPSGKGYVKDRQHVAGFLPHAFSKVPERGDAWKVETIDLVSLLCHPEPVAYVSANLPRMEELRGAPTRPLDGFESSGLGRLRDGEYAVVTDDARRLRMLGSIRAVSQCVKCHGCERGELLGAFSYLLRKTGS